MSKPINLPSCFEDDLQDGNTWWIWSHNISLESRKFQVSIYTRFMLIRPLWKKYEKVFSRHSNFRVLIRKKNRKNPLKRENLFFFLWSYVNLNFQIAMLLFWKRSYFGGPILVLCPITACTDLYSGDLCYMCTEFDNSQCPRQNILCKYHINTQAYFSCQVVWTVYFNIIVEAASIANECEVFYREDYILLLEKGVAPGWWDKKVHKITYKIVSDVGRGQWKPKNLC